MVVGPLMDDTPDADLCSALGPDKSCVATARHAKAFPCGSLQILPETGPCSCHNYDYC